VRSDVPLGEGDVAPLVELAPGEPYDAELLRRSLRNLAVAGLAAEAEGRTRPAGDGIEVELTLRAELRVQEVALEGDLPIREARIRDAIPQKAGRPLREDRVIRGVFQVEDLLGEEGFGDAKVRLDVETEPGAKSVRVIYRLEPGARTLIGAIRILDIGTRPIELPARQALRSAEGRPYRKSTVREDAERLLQFLHSEGYREARVLPVDESRHDDLVDLTWHVELGRRVVLELAGGDRKELAKRGLLPLQGDEGYDEALVLQAVAEIRRFYQERGNYRVAVTSSEREEEGRLVVRIEVEPGERYRLVEVRFEGEDLSFSPDRLEPLLATTRRRLLAFGSGRLVDNQLDEDLANLRSFYALQGFDRARIGPARVAEQGGDLRVTIPIVEGSRRRIASVRIVGAEHLDTAALLAALPVTVGSPYHSLNIEVGAEKLRTELDARGFQSAIVVPEVGWDEERSQADVVFRVLEGERSTAEAIVVRGNSRTDARLVRRFLGISAGEPISLAKQLEAQRGLYALGAFSHVDVQAPVYLGEFAAHEVVVEVEEGRTKSVLLGAGYDSDQGARGLLRLSESNFLGRLQTVQLDALLSQNEQDYRLITRQPYLWRWPIEHKALLYFEQEKRTSFDVRRRGVGTGVSRGFGHLTAGLFANYRLVEEVVKLPDPDIPRESQEAKVASLTASLGYDRRDDPIDPTRGWHAAAEVERATPFLRADADFLKLFGQVGVALPLGSWGTLAGSARGGILFPQTQLGGGGEGEPIDAVPVSELFYAGGRTTHRAFRRDELGIPGSTLSIDENGNPLPRGGGALALVNVDWRIPIAGDFGAVLFVDGGNVWRRYEEFDWGDARWGAGVGVRYRSPLGPLRAEIGWKLDREPFEDPYVISISIGNAF